MIALCLLLGFLLFKSANKENGSAGTEEPAVETISDDVRRQQEEEQAAREKEQERLKNLAVQVSLLIDEMGEVTLENKENIQVARKAYDELESEAKQYVYNYSRLENAEKKIAELEEEEANKPIV